MISNSVSANKIAVVGVVVEDAARCILPPDFSN